LQKELIMFQLSIREMKPSAQLLFAALVLITCGLVISSIGMALSWAIYGFNLSELEHIMQDLSDPEHIAVLKFIQTTQAIGVFIIPPFIIAWMIHGEPSVYLKYNKRPGLKMALAAVAIVFCSNPLINFLNELNAHLSLPDWLSSVQQWMRNSEDQATKITEAFLATTNLSGVVKNVLMIGVLPAIGEELLFRGVVQQLLKRIYKNSHAAIWISAALFSALHLQFFGFLPRLILGVMFGYMLEWSGTLWLPMISHFVNNATAVIAFGLVKDGTITANLDKTGTMADHSSSLVILSVIMLALLFRFLYQNREASQAQTS